MSAESYRKRAVTLRVECTQPLCCWKDYSCVLAGAIHGVEFPFCVVTTRYGQHCHQVSDILSAEQNTDSWLLHTGQELCSPGSGVFHRRYRWLWERVSPNSIKIGPLLTWVNIHFVSHLNWIWCLTKQSFEASYHQRGPIMSSLISL